MKTASSPRSYCADSYQIDIAWTTGQTLLRLALLAPTASELSLRGQQQPGEHASRRNRVQRSWGWLNRATKRQRATNAVMLGSDPNCVVTLPSIASGVKSNWALTPISRANST